MDAKIEERDGVAARGGALESLPAALDGASATRRAHQSKAHAASALLQPALLSSDTLSLSLPLPSHSPLLQLPLLSSPLFAHLSLSLSTVHFTPPCFSLLSSVSAEQNRTSHDNGGFKILVSGGVNRTGPTQASSCTYGIMELLGEKNKQKNK